MSFDREVLLDRLAELEALAGRPQRFVVAFSGGLDSSVLTHALARSRDGHGLPILAVYVDHGLHDESADWGAHCEAFAAKANVECLRIAVSVDPGAGTGLEAAAREARYAALRGVLESGDWLLSAHHEDDQAETVLLHLMRGSGATGLAGMPAARRLVPGWLVRPLMDVPRAELEAYAQRHALKYLVDPANLDSQFDRNYVRQEILPRLDARWPGAAGRIRRSARLVREASTLLAELAEIDRARFADRSGRLSIAGLETLPAGRQRNLLRYVIAESGLPLPGAGQLEEVVRQLEHARDDALPLVAWRGGQARRYRDRLYLMPNDVPGEPPPQRLALVERQLRLPGGLGLLLLREGAERGLSAAVAQRRLEVRFRVGGEKFQPEKQKHTKKLKKLLQEEGVVPWMRDRVPLVYADGDLVAVADLWIAAGAAAAPGIAVEWRNHPAVH